MKVAAIDAGSNAVRLLIGERDALGGIHIIDKYREPIRLGKDVFSKGEIRKKTIDRLLTAFKKFRKVIDNEQVDLVYAVATSAMREAQNNKKICELLFEETGIQLKIISGDQEAQLVHAAIVSNRDVSKEPMGLIDIGGGSVEVGFSQNSKLLARKSFPFGTVRLLQLMNENNLKESDIGKYLDKNAGNIESYIEDEAPDKPIEMVVGTGGNMECMGRLRVVLLQKSSMYEIYYDELKELQKSIVEMSVKDRIQYLRLRADRADVIYPAIMVTLKIMKHMGAKKLCLPNVGLKEGLLLDAFNSLSSGIGSETYSGREALHYQ